MQIDPVISATLQQIHTGLFENRDSATGPDALAWGILALEVSNFRKDGLNRLRTELVNFQMSDGRFSLSKNSPDTFWPTPIALLGLLHSPGFQENKTRAIEFLLTTQGLHWKKQPDDPSQHDPSIIGWPWIENTHSWIIPTALSVITLKICGIAGHPRIAEGIHMILNRQLPAGGWNYGNTIVFKSVLRPIPECTGFALSALQGFVSDDQVAGSLSYLKNQAETLRTPLSLSWALLGLGAWLQRPPESGTWIVETLQKQAHYGPYSLSLLSQLVVSYYSENGLYTLLKQ
jgi:hypothetical protein